ncbi:MAG: hypothetical protein U1E70_28800 [Acetobacteraceae bacterium]|nr:hypothetical protein [Pseudomonadota bacterium]
MRAPRLALLLLVVSGCTPDYPMDREGTWSIPEVSNNEKNLRAMVVNPQDLVVGRGDPNSLGPEAVRPINRLFSGNRAPLPDQSASAIYAIPNSGGGSGGSGQ